MDFLIGRGGPAVVTYLRRFTSSAGRTGNFHAAFGEDHNVFYGGSTRTLEAGGSLCRSSGGATPENLRLGVKTGAKTVKSDRVRPALVLRPFVADHLGRFDMPVERKDIQHCRWADQTLLLDEPYWLNAWDFPWSCHRNGQPHPVEDTRDCRTCARWEPRVADDTKTRI